MLLRGITLLLAGTCLISSARAATRTWSGAVSTDWNVPGNWVGAIVPAARDDIITPSGLTRYPAIVTGQTITAASLFVQDGAGISQSGGSLTLKDVSIGTGASLTLGGGTLIMEGVTLLSGGSMSQTGGSSTMKDVTMEASSSLSLSAGTLTMEKLKVIEPGVTVAQTGGTMALTNLEMVAGSSFTQTVGTLQVGHDWINIGTFTSIAGTVDFVASAGGATDFGAGTNQFFNIVIEPGVDPHFDRQVANILIAGDFTNYNTGLDVNERATFTFNGTGPQTIYSAAASNKKTFGNLVVNNTSATTTITTPILIDEYLTVAAGTLDIGTNPVNSKDHGPLTISSGATLTLAGSFPTGFSAVSLDPASTVVYYGANQTIQGDVTYGNIVLAGTATKTLGGNVTVATKLTMGGSTAFSLGASTLTYGATAALEYKGTAAQTTGLEFPSSMASGQRVIIDNPLGVTLNGTRTINGTLDLTNGFIATGANTLILGPAGSVQRGTGFVTGNFQKYVPTGNSTLLYEVGDANGYAPVTISFGTVTTGGGLIVKSTAGDHPEIGSSDIDSSRTVNRYWTVTGAGVGFSGTYTITFGFTAGSIDAGADPLRFVIGRKSGALWSTPTLGTVTATSAQATGLAAFGDFQVGTPKPATWTGLAGTANWGDALNWSINAVPTSSHDVLLNGADSINVNLAAFCRDLTIANAGLRLTIRDPNTLSVAANLSFTDGTLRTETSFPAVTGSTTISGGTVAYTGTGNQTVLPLNYSSLSIGGGGTKTLSGNAVLTGNLTVGSGTLDLGAFTANRTSPGGALTVSDGATLQIGGTNTLPSNYSTHTFGQSSTVEYRGTAQTVAATSYGHLALINGGTKTAGGNLAAAGNFSIGPGTTFSAGSFTHTVQGDWLNTGSLTAGTSTVQLSGTANTSVSGSNTFNTLTINKGAASATVTLGSSIAAGTVTMAQGILHTGSNSITITSDRTGNGIIVGTITRSHTFVAGLPYAFEGPFNTVTFASGGTLPGSVTITVVLASPGSNDSMEPIDRYYDVSQTGGTGFSYALRLHYEDAEVTAPNSETSPPLQLWRRISSGPDVWERAGASAGNTTENWVEASGQTDVGRWTLSSRTIANVLLTLAQSDTNPPPGAIVTYSIAYSNAGDGTAGSVLITAAVPANTSYVPGSIILNGTGKTDQGGDDEVTVAGSTITIDLGSVAPGTSGNLSYNVMIQ